MDTVILDLPEGAQTTFQIAFVEEEAIESSFQTFKKTTPYKFKELDKSRRIVMGYFMIADKEIDRFDPNRGAYKVKFPRKSIDNIVENWAINGLNKNLNENHNTNEFAEGVFVMSHFQVDSELGINAPKGFEQEADGSWFGIVKCYNDEIYQKCLDGTYNGFSVENVFQEKRFDKVDRFLQELKVTINK